MDLEDQVNKIVRIEKQESKIRSKKDLYYVLRQFCKHYILNILGQYYLSDEANWSIKFLKNVLSGKKM